MRLMDIVTPEEMKKADIPDDFQEQAIELYEAYGEMVSQKAQELVHAGLDLDFKSFRATFLYALSIVDLVIQNKEIKNA